MAQEFREFAVTVPAGTAIATPLVTPIVFPSRTVLAVSWRVPPGPSGHLGWALTSAGAWVIPIVRNTYMVTDNQADTWELDGYLDSGNWAVTAYNTGIYPHTLYLTFALDLTGTAPTSTPPPTGQGVGVVGSTGTVAPPVSTTPPPSQPGSSPSGETEAVVTAVLAAMMTQLRR